MSHAHLDPDHQAAPLPEVLWIELTSKCPFDCVFCSRKLRRGAGEHMDFALYASLIAQLEKPQIIRLNYSGESVHYPWLIEAIELASGTGAQTELVSAFSSISGEMLERLAASDLSRLTVSVHAAEAAQYRQIYRFASFEALLARLEQFEEHCQRRRGGPKLDFAFVAMEHNLGQLEAVAELARKFGIPEIQVLPVLRRDPIPFEFSRELDGSGMLRAGFRERLREVVRAAAEAFPDIRFVAGNPDIGCCHPLGIEPRYFPGPLPAGARISTCDQNPWETAHVLVNGDVVVCEVLDTCVMGNLAGKTLREIWNGGAYREFRRRYVAGAVASCRNCPWKVAYLPVPLTSRIAADGRSSPQLLKGWYDGDDGILWAGSESRVVLARPAGTQGIRLRGVLPPAETGGNWVAVECGGAPVGEVRNNSPALLWFDRFLPLGASAAETAVLRFTTPVTFCPRRRMGNTDERELGFGLLELEAVRAPTVPQFVHEPLPRRPAPGARRRVFAAALRVLDAGCALWRRSGVVRAAPRPGPFAPGVSVIIPDRDGVDLLAECLPSVETAAARLTDPVEIVVVASGAAPDVYAGLRSRHPRVCWLHSQAPLSFCRAVQYGVRVASYDWVYLLNNDMIIAEDALAELLPCRAPGVFAIGSQIFFKDPGRRREETNWTGARIRQGVVELLNLEPASQRRITTSFFVGGGSSLFRKVLLERFMAGRDPYYPFYWEDVEWSTVARRQGYEVLFCPRSQVWHEHRATVRRHYPEEEVQRIFERNRVRYQLRNLIEEGSLEGALRRMDVLDARSARELLAVRSMIATMVARSKRWFDSAAGTS